MNPTAANEPNPGPAENDDGLLIRDFLRGDSRAFELLYHRYRRQLYGFLMHLIGNASEADEVFEETWLKVIDKLPQYRDEGRFSAWLFRVARNLFLDRLRRQRPTVELDAPEAQEIAAGAAATPDFGSDAADLGSVIQKALSALPQDQREVFLLRQQDVAFKEIAEMQGCSVNTALSRMQYALKNLRRFLSGVDGGDLL